MLRIFVCEEARVSKKEDVDRSPFSFGLPEKKLSRKSGKKKLSGRWKKTVGVSQRTNKRRG